MPRWWRRSRPDDELGQGVWRRVHDRFRRAVDRYHQLLERVPVGPARDRLELTGARLAQALDGVREVCAIGQRLAPSEGENLPGGHGGLLLDTHRALARAATVVAQAGEAVTLTIVALGDDRSDEADRLCDGAGRSAEQAQGHVGRALELVRRADAM